MHKYIQSYTHTYIHTYTTYIHSTYIHSTYIHKYICVSWCATTMSPIHHSLLNSDGHNPNVRALTMYVLARLTVMSLMQV